MKDIADEYHHYVGCVITDGTTVVLPRTPFQLTLKGAWLMMLNGADERLKRQHKPLVNRHNCKIGLKIVD